MSTSAAVVVGRANSESSVWDREVGREVAGRSGAWPPLAKSAGTVKRAMLVSKR
jgi:hypothetical protein